MKPEKTTKPRAKRIINSQSSNGWSTAKDSILYMIAIVVGLIASSLAAIAIVISIISRI